MKGKKIHPKVKSNLHPKSKHRERYDFNELIKSYPKLSTFVTVNKYGDESIDFFDPLAVKSLNIALLTHFYEIKYWEIPADYLCPPIPGRADYIHHVAELLGNNNYGAIPIGKEIKCLDIGVGANCIYPIIGVREYGWSFIGADIDSVALKNAEEIVNQNDNLKGKVEFRLQPRSKDFFYGVITKNEHIDITICNPPFHSSLAEANASSQRKTSNLKGKKNTEAIKNFGGKNSELWCDGGENRFVKNMIRESKKFAENCYWFTTLISKQSNLKTVYNTLELEGATEVKTIAMGQGNKTSRIVAWTYLSKDQRKEWRDNNWTGK